MLKTTRKNKQKRLFKKNIINGQKRNELRS